MKVRTTSRILAALLTGAMALPMAQAAFSVSVQATINQAWYYNSVSMENVLPQDVQTAFDMAVKNLNYDLDPLAYYGTQVVAGQNLYLLCRYKQSGSDSWEGIKKVTIYDKLDGTAQLGSVSDFDLESYSENYDMTPYDTPPDGGVSIVSNVKEGNMPAEASSVFNNTFMGFGGAGYVPIAFLGQRYNEQYEGQMYSYLCKVTTATADPDVYISVVTIFTDDDREMIHFSTYDMLAEKMYYGNYNSCLEYQFTGENAAKPGYAEGTLTLKDIANDTYQLYWAYGSNILSGYYPITEMKISSSNPQRTFSFGYHTAIPKDANSVVVVKKSDQSIVDIYRLPAYKVLSRGSGNYLYSFGAYSDIHIDKDSTVWYVNSDKNFKAALQYNVDMNTDYIVVSGDCVTNDSGPEKEYDAYAKMLSESDYLNPVWESNGNHDLHQGVELGLNTFVKYTGTDGSQSGKPYFAMRDTIAGDLFIFMALELNKDPQKYDEFSQEQLTFVTNLIEENYDKCNIFIAEHAPINGFGAGDRMDNPYYGGLLGENNSTTKTFKALLQKYPKVIFYSGHTHEDFDMGYNYSNENNTAANMIHIPALAGSKKANSTDDALDGNGGKGYNAQGYYVQVFENEVIFYGTNLTDKLIYPAYSYIMEGGRTDASFVPNKENYTVTGDVVDGSEELNKVASTLSTYYKYASYDSYQSLKKLYYQYRSMPMMSSSIFNEFENRLNALAVYTGGTVTLGDTYYFVNNKKWDKVYLYAWTGSNKNADWPGVKLSKLTTNSDGLDVYQVKFNSAGEYKNIIFNAGSGSSQTVDIALADYPLNGFRIGSSSSGKYTVENFKYETGSEIETSDTIALLYYITNKHDWTDTNTLMTKDNDGKYRYEYKATGTDTFSFSLYNKTTKKYYSLTESEKPTFESGKTFSYTLSSSSSREKSITFYGLDAEKSLLIEYDPATHIVSVTCQGGTVPAELENNSTISKTSVPQNTSVIVTGAASGGEGDYKYAFYYKKSTSGAWTTIGELYGNTTQVSFVPATVAKYLVKVNVKDSTGKIVTKQYTVNSTKPSGNDLINTSTVDRTTVARNTVVSISGQAAGGAGNYKYAFYYKKATSKAFTAIGEEYGTAATAAFIPAMVADYNIRINVKDQDGTVVTKQYKITVVSAATLLNESTVSATKVTKGTPVKITAAASGATAPYTYSFCYKKSTSSAWTQIKTDESSATFTPAVKATYLVKVVVTDSAGKTASKTFTITSE